jgi:hypothetical protein
MTIVAISGISLVKTRWRTAWVHNQEQKFNMLSLQSSQALLPKPNSIGDDACDYTIIDNTLFISVLCDGVGSAKRGASAARQIERSPVTFYKIGFILLFITQVITLVLYISK